jgi:dienelactone hydrolase
MRALAVLVLLAALHAQAARAEDACLTGMSELADERAIAAFRTSLDDACPCADYTGKHGKNRAAYQRCARTALRAALDATTVRLVCKESLTALNRSAVCGTHAVPCGAVKNGDPSCHARAAGRCKSRGRVDAAACRDATSCADVVADTAGTCIDPRQPGPYAAGIRTVTITKDSVAHPGTPRVLDVLVWYPAVAGTGTPNTQYQAAVDATVDGSAGARPLVMFSHGSCGYAAQSPFLTATLASYGFIVASVPHPGNTIFDGLGTCAQGIGDSLQERPNDVRFALDQMLAANADAASPFFGLVDANRIGMSGHSFGGLTTYLVAAQEPRVKVAVPMAPAIAGHPALAIPSMTMFGQIDAVVPLDPIRQAYADAHAPKFLVEIEDTGHFAFSQGCFPSRDCMPPATRTQAEAHGPVLRWIVPFLEVYLAGDERFRPLLEAPAGPGTVVQSAQ